MLHHKVNTSHTKMNSSAPSSPKLSSNNSGSSAEMAVVALNPTEGASKKCHCKRSKCLKLYCECFSANVLCSGCKCTNCENTGEHSNERRKAVQYKLSRNKTAFDSKFKASAETPTAGQSEFLHVRGCNCKRSNCAKKYCECFQAGVACSSWCKCVECVNDGSLPHLRNFGVYDWMLPACREATGSVIGQESIMMILKQEESTPPLKRRRKDSSQGGTTKNPRPVQQIWTVPLGLDSQQQLQQPVHLQATMPLTPMQQQQLALSLQAVQQPLVQSQTMSYVCNSVTGDSEEPAARAAAPQSQHSDVLGSAVACSAKIEVEEELVPPIPGGFIAQGFISEIMDSISDSAAVADTGSAGPSSSLTDSVPLIDEEREKLCKSVDSFLDGDTKLSLDMYGDVMAGMEPDRAVTAFASSDEQAEDFNSLLDLWVC